MSITRKILILIASSIPIILLLIVLETQIPGLVRPVGIINNIRVKSLTWEFITSLPEKPKEVIGGAWDNEFEKKDWDYNGRHTLIFVETLSGIYKIDPAYEPKFSKVPRDQVYSYNTDCGKINKEIKHPDEVIGYDIFWCGEFDSGRDHYSILSDNSVWKGRIIYSTPGDFVLGSLSFFTIPLALLPILVFIYFFVEWNKRRSLVRVRTQRGDSSNQPKR